jgi:hypothetical protein
LCLFYFGNLEYKERGMRSLPRFGGKAWETIKEVAGNPSLSAEAQSVFPVVPFLF